MDASTMNPAQHVLWSSRLEVLITVARVADAIEALPPLPDTLTVRRWNHGIGRELWIAISAIGMEGASSIALSGPEDCGPPAIACPAIVYLFQAVSWSHRRLAFDLARLDHAGFLTSARTLSNGPMWGGEDWGFPKWWTWSVVPTEGGKAMPSWWNAPTPDVGPPMPVFESDRADIEAVSGKAYKILGELLFQKECTLQGIEGRITELELKLGD